MGKAYEESNRTFLMYMKVHLKEWKFKTCPGVENSIV